MVVFWVDMGRRAADSTQSGGFLIASLRSGHLRAPYDTGAKPAGGFFCFVFGEPVGTMQNSEVDGMAGVPMWGKGNEQGESY